MNIEQSATIREKLDLASVQNLTAAQSIVRSKFAKAYINRLQHERDVHQALQPFAKTHADGEKKEKTQDELNGLCNRLRVLLHSQDAGVEDYAQEINAIIMQLR